jgi:hypothetical protein
MHEYHAKSLVQEHQRRLRDAAEMARLIQEASRTAPRRRRWALVRQRAADSHPQPEVKPAYPGYPSPRRAAP